MTNSHILQFSEHSMQPSDSGKSTTVDQTTEHHRSLNSQVMLLLRRASQHTDEAFAALVPAGVLTPRQYVLMSAIAQHTGASQTRLSSATGIDRSTTSEMIVRLQKRKLVRRQRSRYDARVYNIELSDKGQALLNKVAPKAEEIEKVVLNTLGHQRRLELIETLEFLITGFDKPPSTFDSSAGAN